MERIRKVGDLFAALKAPFLVIADDQSPERNAYSGRVYEKAAQRLPPNNGSTSEKSLLTRKK